MTLALHGGRIVGEIDRVVQALRHLGAPVSARQKDVARDQCVRNGKDRSELLVEAAGDLAGELDMRFLVPTHRDEITFHAEDVGRLQDRIAQEPVRRLRDVVIAHLLLQRRNALRAGDGDEHRKVQVDLGRLRDERLKIDRHLLRIDAHGKVVEDHLTDIETDLVEPLEARGEHVVVGDQQERVVGVLQLHAVLKRADVVAEVKAAGRAIAREDALPGLRRRG